MGFYIRKSISAGPFRFNFSRGGVGVSVGIKGLRIGTGPRGHYIHAGTGGLYYRASLGNAGKRSTVTAPQQRFTPPAQPRQSDVEMIEVESGDVMQMRDESFGELLDEINAKSRQARMSIVLCWIGIILGVLAGLATGGPGLVLGLIAVPGWMIGAWFDSYRRSTVLFYDLEGDAETAFNQLAKGFDGLKSCAGKWHIESGGAIANLTAWKRNAGASHLVNRKPTTLAYSLPAVIKSNVTPPALSVGRQIMYFFPDVVLMQDAGRMGAISYCDLQLRWQGSRFIEDGPVPSDARVVDHTWKHPNKSGGPDRRFKDNRQIPICLYEAIHLQSASGVNELVEFSQTGKAAAFGAGCDLLAALPKEKAPAIAGPAISLPEEHQQSPVDVPRRRTSRVLVTIIAFTLLLGVPVVAIVLASGGRSASVSSVGSRDVDHAAESHAPTPPTVTEDGSRSNPSEKLQPAAAPVSTAPTSTGTAETPAPDTVPSSPSTGQSSADVSAAIVVKTRYGVNVRAGPGKTYEVLSTIKKDVAVTVLETGASWTRIRIDDRTTGWLITDAIQ